ncbi:hypothetical protein [Bradyrhizobium sp. SSUT77]|uniref:hypothetical protein n=1 Tax=Bradyrhizobium sp. SSUT77 TaxID=3040603 RepID=UPI00244898F7|nr:hypothetical protein [Bradyrhizobium sp. SSUT77]MDH2343418.1 hypothetical protein [Bradyrhizobium sp. SSUT77]
MLAGSALAWVASTIPNVADPTVSRVARQIAAGENYDAPLLRQIVKMNLPAAQRQCEPKPLRELLVLQLSAADMSVRGTDLAQADADVDAVQLMSRILLGCAPTESLGWLGAFWSGSRQDGLTARTVAFLGQSYRLAPHEVWLQMMRVPLAFRAFGALPPALTDAAVQDFNDVFHDRLISSAAALFIISPTPVRSRLLDLTCDVSERERLAFWFLVRDAGGNIQHRCYPPDDRPRFLRDN